MSESSAERVLIVEDETIVALEMSDLLESMGFIVVGPGVNQEDGVHLARTAEIDAAFLDVNLGDDKTSQPVAEILRERDIPLMFITAYDASQVTFRLSDERVLRKPVTGSEMLENLRSLLPDAEAKT